MPDSRPALGGAALPGHRFDGPSEFAALLRDGLAMAAAQGWRELVLCDPSFADWPLGERALNASLQHWATSGRRMTVLAERFDVFQRSHARFVEWRRHWDHLIDCRACAGPGLPPVPSGLWSPAWIVERFDIERSRGACSAAPDARAALRERIDECLRHARPGFAATTLGL